MRLPWREDEGFVPAAQAVADPIVAAGQSCPTLIRALDKIFRSDRPEILDLGPLCGQTVVSLADRGARVSVEEFRPPAPTPESAAGDEIPIEPLRIDQPSGRFDLILAWELWDFVPPDRLTEFGGEIRRLLTDHGWLLMLSLNAPNKDGNSYGKLCRYRLLAGDRILREETDGPRCRRWVYSTRQIESALAPMSIQALHLQRNQLREFLAHKGA